MNVTTTRAWADRAGDLAAWAWGRLVNRADVWGAYLPPDRRANGKSLTAPPVRARGRVALTEAVLGRHFRGLRPDDLMGLHSTSPDNRSRWGAIDIDAHADGRADAEANQTAALAWFDRLAGIGFDPLLVDSNGRGGFHLWCLLAEPVPTAKVFGFLKWLTDDFGAFGLAARPEAFPKQPAIRPNGFGNWLRLPGRHHTFDHWSRVWNGHRWLEGEPAVAHLLGLAGRPAHLIPADIGVSRVLPQRPPPLQPLPTLADDELGRRITAYMARLPRLGAGEGRSKAAFGFAAWLVRDLGLDDASALPWLGAWDRGNSPPLGEDDLRDVIRCAREYGQRPRGCALAPLRPAARPQRKDRKKDHAVEIVRFTLEVGK